jgi:hypothetical protein
VSSAPVIAAKLHLAIGAQLGVDISGFPHVAAHFMRMREHPSATKLLAYENEVNEETRWASSGGIDRAAPLISRLASNVFEMI